jgi:ferredoxin-nitrite reductase
MQNINNLILDEIKDFRKLARDFIDGKVSQEEFKTVAGGMGVYAHRDGQEFMIRMRTPGGSITKEQFKTIYDYGKKYNLKYVYLTTRQEVELHGLSIDDACDIMEDALNKGIYTRGTGGNFPRNITMSPLAGVDPSEAFDSTPYALAVNKYFMSKINTYKLPEKLRVSFSTNMPDCGHTTVADLGFMAVKKDGENYFKVYIGGGLGKDPILSIEYPELVEANQILYDVEAMIKLFINEGNYKDKSKAQIKYIAQRMGREGFMNCYNRFKKLEKEKGTDLTIKIIKKENNKKGKDTQAKSKRLFKQKQEGLYSVNFHPIGGQLEIGTMKVILDKINEFVDPELRTTMTQTLFIRNLDGAEAEELLNLTEGLGAEINIEKSVACTGAPMCQNGVGDSQKTLNNILDLLKENNITKDILPKLNISGCKNSCTDHEINRIGFMGKKKKVNNNIEVVYSIFVNGKIGIGKTEFVDSCGDILQDDVPKFCLEMAKKIEKSNKDFGTWINEDKDEFKEILDKYLI